MNTSSLYQFLPYSTQKKVFFDIFAKDEALSQELFEFILNHAANCETELNFIFEILGILSHGEEDNNVKYLSRFAPLVKSYYLSIIEKPEAMKIIMNQSLHDLDLYLFEKTILTFYKNSLENESIHMGISLSTLLSHYLEKGKHIDFSKDINELIAKYFTELRPDNRANLLYFTNIYSYLKKEDLFSNDSSLRFSYGNYNFEGTEKTFIRKVLLSFILGDKKLEQKEIIDDIVASCSEKQKAELSHFLLHSMNITKQTFELFHYLCESFDINPVYYFFKHVPSHSLKDFFAHEQFDELMDYLEKYSHTHKDYKISQKLELSLLSFNYLCQDKERLIRFFSFAHLPKTNDRIQTLQKAQNYLIHYEKKVSEKNTVEKLKSILESYLIEEKISHGGKAKKMKL